MSEIITKPNPLINKLHKSNAMPGVTFRLPSMGLPYKNGEISDEVKDGEVVVFPMSTLDEIYLKTPDMLYQGTAIEKTVSRCCPQILKPLELLSKDIDYILTCMRLVSYGNILTVSYKCECAKSKEVELAVPISDFLKGTKSITNDDVKKLDFELDGFIFKTKFVTLGQMITLNQDNSSNDGDTPEHIFDTFIKNLSVNIESIDSVDDQELIIEFLKAQQRKFQMDVLKHVQDVNNWGMNFDYKFKCKWCNKEKTTSIALNPVSFFTEPSSQAQSNKEEI